MKKQKEEERLALEAKRKAEEEAAKAERERKLEEERQKREQERLRKEEERRQREEERIRKEEDKRRRLKEERERAAEKEKRRKEKEEKEQREREERERIEREKKEALAAKRKAEEDERRAKEQQEELIRQEKTKADVKTDTAKSSSPLPATTTTATTTPMRPVIDEAARQKTLMDALVGAPASSSSSSSSPQPLLNRTSLLSAGIANIPHSMPGDIKPLGMDMPQPPHPLFPPHPFAARDIPPPIGPVRQGEPATSPTRGYAPLGDRGMLPIGHGRLSSSFDAGRTAAPRPGPQIAPIGQPVNGRRPSTTAGPVGSPMGSRNHWLNSTEDGSNRRSPLATSDAENSFFSNFLFGDHGRGIYTLFLLLVNSNMHCLDMSLMHPELATSRLQERRFSLESAGVGWTNGKIYSITTYFI